MPSSDKEVFAYFRSSSDSPEVSGLAYASYAFEKYEWFALHEQRHGSPPTPAEVDEWIASQPESRLDSIVIQATDLFDRAARAYMEEDIGRLRQRAARKAIAREVRESNRRVLSKVKYATSYWRNLPGTLINGFLSSVIFVIVVAICAWLFNKDPSPFAVIKALQNAPAPQSPTKP